MEAVYREKPRICFIMAGVNDIAGGVPVEEVFTNIRLMVQGLRVRQIIPVVQSTLYTRIPRYNRRIERLNTMLAAYSSKFKVDFVDLNASLAHNRLLDRKYTFDGIHLRANAYEQWRKELQRTLELHNVGTAETRSGAPSGQAADETAHNPAEG
jgi:lysophospholipase L1-like esterase